MKSGKYTFLVVLLFLTACKNNRKQEIDFYYWKTNVSLGLTEQDYFKKLESKYLYIRFFDVDNDGSGIRPVAKIKPFDCTLLPAEYVPVIFITNRTFTGITYQGIDELVARICDLIDKIATANHIPEVSEIQIDCDWTNTTRNDYFRFLKKLKEISKKKLSCTIRLHQVADRNKTGVPPVDKGLLMCYATSQPTGSPDKNSILDIPLLKTYLKTVNDYPMALDVALPLYSWAIVTNHLGKVKLINGVTRKELAAGNCFKELEKDRFEVTDDVFFRGFYLNKGFKIKLEAIRPEVLQEAKTYLNRQIKQDFRIVYYHLDEPFLEQYTLDNLKF